MDFLYNLLFCAGADPVECKSAKRDIRAINRKRLKVYIKVVIGVCAIMIIMAIRMRMLWHNLLVYAAAAVLFLLLAAALKRLPDKRGRCFMLCESVFIIASYATGIYIGTVASPGRQATTAIVLLVLMPMLFIMPPLHNIGLTLIYDALFIFVALKTKDIEIARMDVVNASIFGLMSIVVSTYLMTAMMDSVITTRELYGMAERDFNTRLKNRNAYENNMSEYPGKCTNTLSCVYVDVNGLHELNNAKGHAEGDKMLQIVAGILSEEFGPEDTYRVGGDEFVAFVLDESHEEMQQTIQKFVGRVEAEGYSVAVGTATHSAGGMDMEKLVKLAEQRMYMAKKKHYEEMGEPSMEPYALRGNR